jgi:hypothetical protein
MTLKDKDSLPFDGKKTYCLTVPPNTPVKLYWSATAYDPRTHALIGDASRSSRASNSADLRKNAESSVDIYFGPKTLDGKELNRVPMAGRRFEVLFRLCGPEQTLFDKTWRLPDLQEVK